MAETPADVRRDIELTRNRISDTLQELEQSVVAAGRVVEQGLCDQLLADPQHPYTQLLVSSQL